LIHSVQFTRLILLSHCKKSVQTCFIYKCKVFILRLRR